MMRRVVGAAAALVCVALLSSCSLVPSPPGSFFDDDEQVAAAQMQHIAKAVKDHDAAALKKLFSPRALEKAADLDSGLKYFLSAFPSGRVTWTTEGTGDSGSDEYFKHALELFGNYKVSKDGQKYDVYFAYFSRNDFHPDEVGIYALGVEPSPATPYMSDGSKWPFDAWASQFDIDDGSNAATGNPGVYTPRN